MPIPFVSFRDTSGQVVLTEDRVLRFVTPGSIQVLDRIQGSATLRSYRLSKKLIDFTPVEEPVNLNVLIRKDLGEGIPGRWLEHPRIPFPTYPEEWTSSMLREAAGLTLELAVAALQEDLELKDATPRNILFQGTKAVFVDLLSFQDYQGTPYWKAYHQFVRSFLLPLLLNIHLGMRLDRCFLPDREGIDLGECGSLLGPFRSLRRPFLGLVTIPNLLSRIDLQMKPPPGIDRETARSICLRRLRGLKKRIDLLRRRPIDSQWTDYECNRTYSERALAAKREWIAECVGRISGEAWVLDLGANTGEFSLLASRHGHFVIAVDNDEPCMDHLFMKARAENTNLLPVVMNLGRPTPACGWALAEQTSFLTRAKGRFELVLALALIHHLRFVEAVPFAQQMLVFRDFSTRFIVVEWVEPWDPQVKSFIERFGYLPEDFSRDAFERCLPEDLRIRDCKELPDGNRWLYLLEKVVL